MYTQVQSFNFVLPNIYVHVSLPLQNWVDEVLRSELLVGSTSAATSCFSCSAAKRRRIEDIYIIGHQIKQGMLLPCMVQVQYTNVTLCFVTSLHCFLSFRLSSTSRRTSFSRFSTYACIQMQTNHLVKYNIIELAIINMRTFHFQVNYWLCWLRCWF